MGRIILLDKGYSLFSFLKKVKKLSKKGKTLILLKAPLEFAKRKFLEKTFNSLKAPRKTLNSLNVPKKP